MISTSVFLTAQADTQRKTKSSVPYIDCCSSIKRPLGLREGRWADTWKTRVRPWYLRKTKLDVTAQAWSQRARDRGRRIAMKLGQSGLHSEFWPTRGTELGASIKQRQITQQQKWKGRKSDVQSPRLRTPYLGGKKRKDSNMRSYGLLTPSGWTTGERQPWIGCPGQSCRKTLQDLGDE